MRNVIFYKGPLHGQVHALDVEQQHWLPRPAIVLKGIVRRFIDRVRKWLGMAVPQNHPETASPQYNEFTYDIHRLDYPGIVGNATLFVGVLPSTILPLSEESLQSIKEMIYDSGYRLESPGTFQRAQTC